MKPRHEQKTEGREKQWRCPCGARLGLEVQRTEHDEDDLPIRIRVCKNCGEPLATEEKPIPLASFYTRANSHMMRNLAAYRLQKNTCAKCGGRYKGGTYSRHVNKPAHLAALSTNPTARSRALERARRRRDYWRTRGFSHLEEQAS